VGRIREADQLRRRYDFALPVEVRYDDFTPDIAENQLLLAAADRLLPLPDLYDETRKLLRHLLTRLDGVGRRKLGRPLPRWQPTPLNRRYQTALGLADLVLRAASYELDGTPGEDAALRADGLMVLNMWKVFENFVTVGLTNALRPYGGGCTPQDRRHHLDDACPCQLIPDLVYERPGPGGVPVPAAVVDAKYKIEIGPSGQNSDLFQMLAYCTVLGLDRGHLLYAEGPAQPLRHIVHGGGIEIVQHSLDLSLPPDELLAQVAALAADIAGARSAP
jgi:5-methylcytosine-specific restriction enzyme subunit McrC